MAFFPYGETELQRVCREAERGDGSFRFLVEFLPCVEESPYSDSFFGDAYLLTRDEFGERMANEMKKSQRRHEK